jgi:hypothetical protein
MAHSITKVAYETATRSVTEWSVETDDGLQIFFKRRWAAKYYAAALDVSDAEAARALADLRDDKVVVL